MLTAIAYKTPLIIYANGMGPLKRRFAKKTAAFILRRACHVSLRDAMSADMLEKLGISRENIAVSADPVYMIRVPKRAETGNIFAVSLRECVNADIPKDELFDLCKKLSQRYSLTPVFISMQEEYDDELCREAALFCGGFYSGSPDFHGLAKILSRAKLAIGMRLHFLLASAMSGTPFIALSYDRKIDGAAAMLRCRYVHDIEDIDTETVLCEAGEILENRESLSRSLLLYSEVLRDEAIRDCNEVMGIVKSRKALPCDDECVTIKLTQTSKAQDLPL